MRRLIDEFYARLRAIVEPLETDSLLDAGCGEGETLARLGAALPERAVGVDISAKAAAHAAERLPSVEFRCENVLSLPFDDNSFDLVLCLEVLEHVEDPGSALDELVRVARGHLVISVPHEPWFRLGSLLRGKYLRGLGNHPEHVNHWSPTSLHQLLNERIYELSLVRSFPWLIAHGRPRRG